MITLTEDPPRYQLKTLNGQIKEIQEEIHRQREHYEKATYYRTDADCEYKRSLLETLNWLFKEHGRHLHEVSRIAAKIIDDAEVAVLECDCRYGNCGDCKGSVYPIPIMELFGQGTIW